MRRSKRQVNKVGDVGVDVVGASADMLRGRVIAELPLPKRHRSSLARDTAEALLSAGVGKCVKGIGSRQEAAQVAWHVRAMGFKTSVGEVEGHGWGVWLRGPK